MKFLKEQEIDREMGRCTVLKILPDAQVNAVIMQMKTASEELTIQDIQSCLMKKLCLSLVECPREIRLSDQTKRGYLITVKTTKY